MNSEPTASTYRGYITCGGSVVFGEDSEEIVPSNMAQKYSIFSKLVTDQEKNLKFQQGAESERASERESE
jgi:hypothetical protein